MFKLEESKPYGKLNESGCLISGNKETPMPNNTTNLQAISTLLYTANIIRNYILLAINILSKKKKEFIRR